jgi:hypothetical protein
MKKLQITERNVRECTDTRNILVQHLSRLVEMTRHYPVICVFAQYRHVFTCRKDIQDLIDSLNSELERFAA